MSTKRGVKIVPGGLKSFLDTFLKGVWQGMGPDLTKRTTSKKKIKKGVRL